jgi:hypothetical protein
MSYTQFVATATVTVVDDFNLNSFLTALADRCVSEENFIYENYGEDDGVLDLDFECYVHQNGDKILIECDTEESNGNSEVWDWLIDQFLPIMTSDLAKIKSATIDSRSGLDVDVCFCDKNGNCIDVDNIVSQYTKMSS